MKKNPGVISFKSPKRKISTHVAFQLFFCIICNQEMMLVFQFCIVNDPRSKNPYNRLYTVEYLNNMSGGRQVLYINQPIEVLKKLTIKSLADGKVSKVNAHRDILINILNTGTPLVWYIFFSLFGLVVMWESTTVSNLRECLTWKCEYWATCTRATWCKLYNTTTVHVHQIIHLVL